jgi:hypothetical protein
MHQLVTACIAGTCLSEYGLRRNRENATARRVDIDSIFADSLWEIADEEQHTAPEPFRTEFRRIADALVDPATRSVSSARMASLANESLRAVGIADKGLGNVLSRSGESHKLQLFLKAYMADVNRDKACIYFVQFVMCRFIYNLLAAIRHTPIFAKKRSTKKLI